jgi:hypothetical protein
MENNIPSWATEKQKEGMEEFNGIADEYGNFKVEFSQSEWADDDTFYANITWGNHFGKGERKHTIRIGWNYEQYFDHLGVENDTWQFIFSDGDCTREMSTEVLFLDLFSYLDGIAITKNQNEAA